MWSNRYHCHHECLTRVHQPIAIELWLTSWFLSEFSTILEVVESSTKMEIELPVEEVHNLPKLWFSVRIEAPNDDDEVLRARTVSVCSIPSWSVGISFRLFNSFSFRICNNIARFRNQRWRQRHTVQSGTCQRLVVKATFLLSCVALADARALWYSLQQPRRESKQDKPDHDGNANCFVSTFDKASNHY